MFRPQLSYPPALPGHRFEQFHYSFDSTNTPALVGTLGAGLTLESLGLPTQQDADFLLRGVQITGELLGLLIRFKEPFGYYLSDDFVPIAHAAVPDNTGLLSGTFPVVQEAQWLCPAGCTIWVYLKNPTLVALPFPRITFLGVKVWPEDSPCR